MKRHLLWSGLAVLLTTGPGAAESLYGSVVWSGSDADRPIPYAEIRACPVDSGGECRKAVTGSDGTFSMTELPAGAYTMEVTYPGAETGRTKTLEIPEGRAVWFDYSVD